MKVTKEQDTTLGALNITSKASISPLQVYKEQIPLNSEEAVFQKIPVCISLLCLFGLRLVKTVLTPLGSKFHL